MSLQYTIDSLKDLEEWLDDIRHEVAPIIVEGARDEESLRDMEVFGEVLQLNRGESLVVFCENVGKRYKRVIVLTDWDRTGGRLARTLYDGLQANGLDVDMNYRARLARICKKETKDVEGVSVFYRRLKDKVGL